MASPGLLVHSDFELWTLLDATAFAVARLRQMELAGLGLTIEQAAILDLLHRVGGFTSAREIERITMRQHHSISILINRMVSLGLLSREKGSGDKSHRISVTTSGKDVFRNLPVTSISRIFGPLIPDERRHLAASLSALHEKSRQLLGVPYAAPFLQQAATGEPGLSGQDNEEYPSNYRLWSLLNRTRFATGRLRELELLQFGVTVEQASMLETLNKSGGTASAKALRMTTLRQHHSISTLVNRMTSMGLLEKRVPRTREGCAIAVTDKGKRLAERMTTAAVEITFSALSQDEKRVFATSLGVLNQRARGLLLSTSGAPVAGGTDPGD